MWPMTPHWWLLLREKFTDFRIPRSPLENIQSALLRTWILFLMSVLAPALQLAHAQTNLSASPTSIAPGGTLTASWSGIPNPTGTDWIGMYTPGAAHTAYIDWIYVSCSKTPGSPMASGSCPFVVPTSTTSGTYQLRLFANNAFTILSTSNNFAVTGLTTLTLTASPTSIPAGGTLTASWSGITSPTSTDWIGMYAPGAADTAYIDWIYVSCSKTPGGAMASGSCPFVVPSSTTSGTYQLRLFANGAFTRLTTSNSFTVTNPGPDLVVSSLSNPPAGAVVGASFSVFDTTANTGIGSAGASITRYRLSLDAVITGTDPLLTGSRSIPALAAGGSSMGNVSVTIPIGVTPNTYFLGACADHTQVVSESNETNNCRASTTTVTVSSAATTTRYVAPNGNDTTGDGTSANPWATAQKCHDSWLAGGAGRTCVLKAGAYYQSVNVTASGTAAAPIVFEGECTSSASPCSESNLWLSAIHGQSTNVSGGWTLWDGANGIYRKNLGFNPAGLTDNNRQIWKIADLYMDGEPEPYMWPFVNGIGHMSVAPTATTTDCDQCGEISYWDYSGAGVVTSFHKSP
jgi:CARDB